MTETTEDELSLDADLAQAISLAELYQHEAEHAMWQAKREELAYQQERLEREWQLDGIYTFHKHVSQKSVDKLLHTMAVWHRHDEHAPWTINLNSIGGEGYAGYALIDELRAHSIRGGGTHRLTIKVRGVAASAGGMILQSADWRVMGRYSLLMIHKGGVTIEGAMDADTLLDEAEWIQQQVDQMIALFLDRTKKITRPEFLRKIGRRDWWIKASEAVTLGLADAIG